MLERERALLFVVSPLKEEIFVIVEKKKKNSFLFLLFRFFILSLSLKLLPRQRQQQQTTTTTNNNTCFAKKRKNSAHREKKKRRGKHAFTQMTKTLFCFRGCAPATCGVQTVGRHRKLQPLSLRRLGHARIRAPSSNPRQLQPERSRLLSRFSLPKNFGTIERHSLRERSRYSSDCSWAKDAGSVPIQLRPRVRRRRDSRSPTNAGTSKRPQP